MHIKQDRRAARGVTESISRDKRIYIKKDYILCFNLLILCFGHPSVIRENEISVEWSSKIMSLIEGSSSSVGRVVIYSVSGSTPQGDQ